MSLDVTYSRLGTFGALGNQLWEIASCIGIANKFGGNVVFPQWDYAPYFSLPDTMFADSLPVELDLSGQYLQNVTYIRSVDTLIRYFFSPSYLAAERISQSYPEDLEKYTAVHVRRANNLGLPLHHPVPPLEYFQQALDLVQPEKLIVFSDDLNWCRQQSCFAGAQFGLDNDPTVPIQDLTGARPVTLDTVALDLLAMAKCRNFIISNSTFSWWGAYLAKHFTVVYPRNWYGPAVPADYTLMMNGLGWTGI